MREHEQFRSPWNKEEENDQIIINVDHQKEKENKKNKNFRGQWKNSRHHPLSRPLPKERKMEKRKSRESSKNIFSNLLGEQCFSKVPNFHRSPDAVRGACPMNTVVNLQTASGKSQVWKLAVQTKFTHSRMENQVKQQKHVSSNRASR